MGKYCLPESLANKFKKKLSSGEINPEELFELANPVASQMRMFVFNEIPVIDFMSSHMFSEQLFETFYNCIFHQSHIF